MQSVGSQSVAREAGTNRLDQRRRTRHVDLDLIQLRMILQHDLVHPAQPSVWKGRAGFLGRTFRQHGCEFQCRIPPLPLEDLGFFIDVTGLPRAPIQVHFTSRGAFENVSQNRFERREARAAGDHQDRAGTLAVDELAHRAFDP